MKENRFTQFLTSNLHIDGDALNELVSKCQVKHVQKGEFLLRQGDHCEHSFFVESGLLRQYGIDEKGKEHIIHFAPENWFVTDREAVFFKQPAKFFIQALEESRLLLLNEQFIQHLTNSMPSFLAFNNRLLHNHVRQQTNRIYQLLSATAEERYLDFISIYPDIMLRVPQAMVASYLGITPESLSRVRKELALKNQSH